MANPDYDDTEMADQELRDYAEEMRALMAEEEQGQEAAVPPPPGLPPLTDYGPYFRQLVSAAVSGGPPYTDYSGYLNQLVADESTGAGASQTPPEGGNRRR